VSKEPIPLTMTPKEEGAFYQSGLVASHCLEYIDEYMNQSIIRYGRILQKLKEDEVIEAFKIGIKIQNETRRIDN